MEMIWGQVRFGIAGFFLGIILRFFYDFVLATRTKPKTALARRLVEDTLFWLAVSFFVFQVMLELNQGILRSYFLILFFLGIFFYQRVSQGCVVSAIRRFFALFFRPYVWFLKKIRKKKEKSQKSP